MSSTVNGPGQSLSPTIDSPKTTPQNGAIIAKLRMPTLADVSGGLAAGGRLLAKGLGYGIIGLGGLLSNVAAVGLGVGSLGMLLMFEKTGLIPMSLIAGAGKLFTAAGAALITLGEKTDNRSDYFGGRFLVNYERCEPKVNYMAKLGQKVYLQKVKDTWNEWNESARYPDGQHKTNAPNISIWVPTALIPNEFIPLVNKWNLPK